MTTASALRAQIEASLAHRIPSALTPAPRVIRPVSPTGIANIDELLQGGLPLGAITEVVGPECSGRTTLALSFVAQITQTDKVCAWIDVSNTLDPASAAAIGVDLNALLWVRCGVPSASANPRSPKDTFALPEKYLVPKPGIKGLHGGGCGPHPRGEVKGLSDAVGGFLRPEATAPTTSPAYAEQQPQIQHQKEPFDPLHSETGSQSTSRSARFTNHSNNNTSNNLDRPWLDKPSPKSRSKPYSSIDQALRVADLLLQAGGFSAIVLDMGSIAPEHASRVPLATWFRYRAAAERSQASILLLTQHPCAKSSAGLHLSLQPGRALQQETTLFTGIEHRVAIARERFKPESPPSKIIPLRKPPQREHGASWQSRTAWSGSR